MKNRLCPSEEILSAYLSHTISEENRTKIEKHLSECNTCRELVADAHYIVNRPSINQRIRTLFIHLNKNKWLIGAAIALTASFFFPKYFMQFLAATILMGIKWIIDSKSTRMLITVYDAWKSSNSDKTFSEFDRNKKIEKK